jgi:uncharacterized small protein (DUF1192 family)
MISKVHAFRRWEPLALACIALTLPAFAQDTLGTGTDTMQVFRGMSATEQQQGTQRIGLGQGAGTNTAANSALASEQAARAQDLEAMRFRLQLQQRQELEQRLPILRSEDWVVIERTEAWSREPRRTTSAPRRRSNPGIRSSFR